jgi:hypothetical protein
MKDNVVAGRPGIDFRQGMNFYLSVKLILLLLGSLFLEQESDHSSQSDVIV